MTTPPPTQNRWGLAIALFLATCASTLFVGTLWGDRWPESWLDVVVGGYPFALPLMAILLAHELGHFFAGRHHGVDISPPYFIPLPIMFGTMGAVIRMRSAIRSRNALLDVGAAGPLAGLAVALPVLIYGLLTSDVRPELLTSKANPLLPPVWIEGHSLLYHALIFFTRGPIPDGYEVWLTPTALAGWIGLLVTMINLLPVGQLDGGHIAYALFGIKQDRYSVWIRWLLLPLGVAVGLVYAGKAYLENQPTLDVLSALTAGQHWLVWALVLWVLTRLGGSAHPPTGPEPLSATRRAVAIFTLILFVLLFMPSWLREH